MPAPPVGSPWLYHPAAYDVSEAPPTLWHATAGDPPVLSPFVDGSSVDVAIIGGGFTGLSAAYHLARDHGVSALVLEAGSLGWGASGRNGGFCVTGGAWLSLTDIAKRHGREAALGWHGLMQAAIDRVAGLIRDEEIDAQPQPGGELLLAHSERAFEALRRRRDAEAALTGHAAELLTQDDTKARGQFAPGFHGGLLEPGFGLHPLRYLRGLARTALRRGVTVVERCPVTAWRRDGARHRLETPQGAISSTKVIVAAGGYQPEALSPMLAGRVLPALSNIIVTRPLTPDEQSAQGWTSTSVACDTRTLLHYFRLLPDGRFLFGGRGGASGSPEGAARFFAALERDFRREFPAWRHVEITHRWRGLVDLSADGAPHCAALDEAGTVLEAFAYHGSGVAMGTEMGAALACLAAGVPAALPAFVARPAPRFPLPLLRKVYLNVALAAFAANERFRPG